MVKAGQGKSGWNWGLGGQTDTVNMVLFFVVQGEGEPRLLVSNWLKFVALLAT